MVPVVSIDLLEYENHILRIDGSVDRMAAVPPAELEVQVNGSKIVSGCGRIVPGCDQTAVGRTGETPGISWRYTGRFADVTLREETLTDRQAFVLELPISELQKENTVEFLFKNCILPVLTGGYQAKVCAVLKNSYWCFEDYMVTLRRDSRDVKGLYICRAGRMARIRRETAFLKEILCASYGSKKMFAVRLLYWLAQPIYKRKNIWITFDKLYKGGDCGEYFYKYMLGRRSEGITPVYVIRRDAPDYQRLVKEGCTPAVYRSIGQRLSYLYGAMVFGTHSGVHSFCGFNNWEIQFVQDRLRAVNTCIQHGLTVQNLQADSNRIINNNKRYYCASHCEIENLSRPEYDYPSEALRLTGIPRYDGLAGRARKQILITPTWRSYIAMPSVMGSARPYNPEFKNTEYYRIFQSLLEDKRLNGTAEKSGYRIVYLLHPVISAQKQDFHSENQVEILSALESNYEQLLTESSLMVTDYSGVQFDFAYMRKPVVYFHPPELPPHYEEGGFSYDTQGFGEICRGREELVSVLCGYMETGCALKEFYRTRENAFFAFQDRDNCRRIFEDALAYQRRQ